MVFRTGTNQRYAANVDFFNDVFLTSTRSHRFGKRVEVNHHQIVQWDFVLRNFRHVLCQFSACQNAAKNLGMQCLNTSAQNTWVTSDVFNGNARDAKIFNELPCSTGRIQCDIFFVQCLHDFVEAVFVKYRN